MANGNGSISPFGFLQQHVGDWLTDDVAPTDHYHLGTLDLRAGTDEELLDTGRGAGHIVRLTDHQPAHVYRVKAVDVLLGVDGVKDLLLVQSLGQRQLDEDTVYLGVFIELIYQSQQVFL